MIFAIHQHELAIDAHVTPPSPELSSSLPPHSILPGCHRALALGALHHTSNSHWLSILHMVMYVFQFYSLTSSHPLLLPLCTKVCSLHLFPLCYPTHKISSTIFLGSTNMS